eukprot:m.1633740 g.1633740  ORF g.1633740 m.1633740 type:complete len:3183 (+) comp25410_c1_seq2:60-9608(+)
MPRTVKLQRTAAHGLGLSIVTQDTPEGSTLQRVSEVKDEGPAKAGGVCVGDTILSVNGVQVGGSSHEFTLTAFGLSLDGDVVLELEGNATPITAADALKPPVPLIARKSSSNLLQIRQRTSSASPQKDAPEYDIAVSPSKALSPGNKVQAVKHVTIQSNPSTGYIGLCLMCFADGKLRIGGVHPRGPFKNATEVELGMIVVNINGEDVRGVPMERIISKITQNRGERITFGFAKDKGADFAEMVDEETERLVWFEQGESTTLGLNMVSTEDGTRIYEILTTSADTPGQYTCLKQGDILLGANGMDVSTSSYAEALRAVTLERSPTILVHRCKEPIEVVPAKPLTDGTMLAEAESLQALVASQQSLGDTVSLSGSTASFDERRGERKTVVLEKDEELGLGLTLCTAGDKCGARIERLVPASPAKLSGRIKVGDHIISANGLDLTHSSHDEVCAAVSVGKQVTLVLEEDNAPLGISASQANRQIRASKTSPARKSSRQSLFKRGKKPSSTSLKSMIDSTTRVVNVPIDASGLGLKVVTDAAKGARIAEILEGNTAAQNLDVRAGDQIITANGISLKGKSHDQIIKAMMQRASTDQEVVLELRGDRTPLKSDTVVKTAVIHRAVNEGIGLKIHSAGQEEGDSVGARVSEVIPGRPASRTTNIKAGDWLLEANGVRLDQLNHDQIVAALQSLKGKTVTLKLREDNSPMEDMDTSPKKSDQGIVIGDVSMLSDIRVVQVERDPRTALLGFQFYSEASLPWVRVCDIDPHSQCASTELRSEDVIITLDGVDYLNRGHDAIFTALRGDSKTVTLQVGRPPKNESPKLYAAQNGASVSAAPVLATYSAEVTGSDISVKEIFSNQFSVEKIRSGSKTAAAGVRQKDLLLRIGKQFVLDIGIQGVRKAFKQIKKSIPCVFGRHYPETLVSLTRDSSDVPWGFDIVYVPSNVGAESETAGEYMIARLQMDAVGGTQGLRHGDVIVAVNGVIAPKAAPVDGVPGPSGAVHTPDTTLTLLVRRDADVPRRVITVKREPGASFGVGFATNDGLPGAYVSKVIPGGAGDKAGVQVNDVVTAINGITIGIRSHDEVVNMVRAGPSGPDADENTLTLKLGHNAINLEREFLQMKTAVLRRGRAGLGMKFVTKEDGVSYPRISHIEKGGVADLCGNIAYGDKIISVNNQSMSGITAQNAVEILVLSNTLHLQLVPDLTDMYTVTQYIDPSIPPTLDPATLEQDWYVGEMPLADTKEIIEAAEFGGFLIRLKKADRSAYTLFIKDESGTAKMYGIKWKPELAQYVFGERYKFESLSGLVKSLRKSGIPASNGKRLHLHDAALNYTDWFVLDSDANLPLLLQHVEQSADPHAFVVRQRPDQQGVYMLITKNAQGTAITIAIRWSEDRQMYLLCTDEDTPYLFNSIRAMVDTLTQRGVPGLEGGTVPLGAPCVAGYDPALAAQQLEASAPADAVAAASAPPTDAATPAVGEALEVPSAPGLSGDVPPPAVRGSAASAIAAAFAAAETAAKEAALATSGADHAAASYQERKHGRLDEDEDSEHAPPTAPANVNVEVGADDDELPALPSDESSDEEELPTLAPDDDEDSDDELPEMQDDDDDDDDDSDDDDSEGADDDDDDDDNVIDDVNQLLRHKEKARTVGTIQGTAIEVQPQRRRRRSTSVVLSRPGRGRSDRRRSLMGSVDNAASFTGEVWACATCHKEYKQQSALTRHMKQGCLTINWRCGWCECKLEASRGRAPGPDGPSTLCSKCGALFRHGYSERPPLNASGAFECVQCKEEFKSIRSLSGHRRYCPGKVWQCSWCSVQSKSRRRGPDGPQTLCCYCSQRYKAGYKTAPTCNAAHLYECEACQHVFDNVRGLTAHQRTCSGGTWRCRWCASKECETKGKGPGPDGPSTLCSVCASRYRSGYKQPPTRDAQGNFVCDRCQAKFASVRGLGSHVRGCSGGNWCCEWCGTPEGRARGKSPGPNGPKTLCSKCGSRFRNGQTQPIERDDNGNFLCDRCGRAYDSMIRLSGHKRFCNGASWRCQWCQTPAGKDSGAKGTGPDGPRTLCGSCSSRFRAGYTTPLATDRDGRYICEDCERRFDTVSGLGGHKRFCTREVSVTGTRRRVDDLSVSLCHPHGSQPALPQHRGTTLAPDVVGDALQIWSTLSFLKRFSLLAGTADEDSEDSEDSEDASDKDYNSESDDSHEGGSDSAHPYSDGSHADADDVVASKTISWKQIESMFLMNSKTASRTAMVHSVHVFVLKIVYDDLYRNTDENDGAYGGYDGRPLNAYTWMDLLRQYLEMRTQEYVTNGDVDGALEYGAAAGLLRSTEFENLTLKDRIGLLILATNSAVECASVRTYMDKMQQKVSKAKLRKKQEYTDARKRIQEGKRGVLIAEAPPRSGVTLRSSTAVKRELSPARPRTASLDADIDTIAVKKEPHCSHATRSKSLGNAGGAAIDKQPARTVSTQSALAVIDDDCGTVQTAGSEGGHDAADASKQTRRKAEAHARQAINFRYQGILDDLACYRRQPLGLDRNYFSYWVLGNAYDRIWVQSLRGSRAEHWLCIETLREVQELVKSLLTEGEREAQLRTALTLRMKRFAAAMPAGGVASSVTSLPIKEEHGPACSPSAAGVDAQHNGRGRHGSTVTHACSDVARVTQRGHAAAGAGPDAADAVRAIPVDPPAGENNDADVHDRRRAETFSYGAIFTRTRVARFIEEDLAESVAWRCRFCQEAFTHVDDMHCSMCHKSFDADTSTEAFEMHKGLCLRQLKKSQSDRLTDSRATLPLGLLCLKGEMQDINDAISAKSVKHWDAGERHSWVTTVKLARTAHELEDCLLEFIAKVDRKYLDPSWRPWNELQQFMAGDDWRSVSEDDDEDDDADSADEEARGSDNGDNGVDDTSTCVDESGVQRRSQPTKRVNTKIPDPAGKQAAKDAGQECKPCAASTRTTADDSETQDALSVDGDEPIVLCPVRAPVPSSRTHPDTAEESLTATGDSVPLPARGNGESVVASPSASPVSRERSAASKACPDASPQQSSRSPPCNTSPARASSAVTEGSTAAADTGVSATAPERPVGHPETLAGGAEDVEQTTNKVLGDGTASVTDDDACHEHPRRPTLHPPLYPPYAPVPTVRSDADSRDAIWRSQHVTTSSRCLLWLCAFDAVASYGDDEKVKNLKRKIAHHDYSNSALSRPRKRSRGRFRR